jgi:hypothetical protein
MSSRRELTPQDEIIQTPMKIVLNKVNDLSRTLTYDKSTVAKKVLKNNPHNHQVLDQINQVLGRIRLTYLPLNESVPFNLVSPRKNDTEHEHARYRQDHAEQFPQLLEDDYVLTMQQKLEAFTPLIDELSGHRYAPFRNLGKALLGLALVATAVMVSAYVCPVVGAAVVGAVLKLGLFNIAAGIGATAVAGASFFYAGRQQGLSKSVDSLVQLPLPGLA